MRDIHRVDVLGCPFDAISFAETVSSVRSAIRNNNVITIVPGSIDFVIKARRSREFSEVLWGSDLIIADGKPIVWLASILGDPIKKRVSGTDLVWSCAEVSEELRCPVALVGGAADTAHRAANKMRARFPGAQLHAVNTPFPLRPEHSVRVSEVIKSLGCKIVLVALGAPRQELWIREYLRSTGANVGVGIGSAFDIISGDRSRAPRWMQDAGLEWFYRMMQEPRRLGRRYLIDDSRILVYLIVELIQRKNLAGRRYQNG